MLQLNSTRKSYMESPMTLTRLTLSDLESSKSKSLKFRSVISRKGAELGPTLQLIINRKAYVGSPFVRLHLTLVTLKGQCQSYNSDVESLYLVRELS